MSGRSTENTFRTRATSRSAKSEFPPRSKKLSCVPTLSTFNSSDQIAASCCSVAVHGAANSRRNDAWLQSGSGRALRSTLPLDVVGRAPSVTNAVGIM